MATTLSSPLSDPGGCLICQRLALAVVSVDLGNTSKDIIRCFSITARFAGITLSNNPFGRLRPGGGIFYLNYTYSGGFRNGRITQRIRELLSTGSGKVSFEDMQDVQADVTLLDAQVFVPFISSARHNGMRAVSALPGGTSGILGSPFYFNLLPGWLINDAFALLFTQDAIEEHTVSVTKFVPVSKPD
jgi:hypothetical protein